MEVDKDSLIYDLDDLEEEDMVVDCQRDMLTNRWGEDYQQHTLQEEPKVEDQSNVYGCVLQKYSYTEIFQERDGTIIFSCQFYDPIADCMTTFFGQ